MAIALDSTSNGGEATTQASVSWSHTIAGSNTLLYVGVAWRSTVTASVTYNSVSMTEVQALTANTVRVQGFYLAAPTSGANTVTVTWSMTSSRAGAAAISLTGVDQTTPVDASNSATGTGNPATVSVTTVADQNWVLDVVDVASEASIVVDSAQTQTWKSEASGDAMGVSYKGPNSSGSISMTWNDVTDGRVWSMQAASFKPAAAAAAGGVWRRMRLGIGM